MTPILYSRQVTGDAMPIDHYHFVMREQTIEEGGLSGVAVGDPHSTQVVVVLHGRDMCGRDLVPFAHSLNVPSYFVFPDGPSPAGAAHAWWPTDSEARLRRLDSGAMDLSAMDPPGRTEARERLGGLCDVVAKDRQLVLVGFSQGGMLAMDYILHGGRANALALLSSTRIAFDDWRPRLPILSGLPVLVTHGRADREIAFAAGEGLRDAAASGGAEVTWLPFDGGHEIPLVVWRGLRQFLRQV